MLKNEFIELMQGVRWSNRACSFDTVDCWGLVVLYYRHVLKTEIHHTPNYESGSNFMTCFNNEVEFWNLSESFTENGIFVAYYGKQPVHVGLIVNGMAFHSRGENGHVRLDQIRTLNKIYTKLEFYYYADNRNTTSARAAERSDIGCSGH